MSDDLEKQLSLVARRLSRPVKLHGPSAVPLLDRPAFTALRRLVEDGPMRPTALAGLLELDLSVVSRQLKALEDAGFVSREPDPADARATLIAPTATGAEVYSQTWAKRAAILDEALGDWTAQSRADLAALLARFNADLDRVVERRRTDA